MSNAPPKFYRHRNHSRWRLRRNGLYFTWSIVIATPVTLSERKFRKMCKGRGVVAVRSRVTVTLKQSVEILRKHIWPHGCV